MKKTLALLLAMVMTVSVALTGCKSKEEVKDDNIQTTEEPKMDATGMSSKECKGTVLRWSLSSDPQMIDPSFSSGRESDQIINNTFEGLMRDKNDGQGPQPAAAAEMPEETENKDGTVTLTYKIRDSKWSDGQPVKAQDFVYSWQRTADPATASPYSYTMALIAGYDKVASGDEEPSTLAVKAVDDTTLEVTLKQPTPYFNELLGSPAFMPLRSDLVDTEGKWAKDPARAISNGPFTLKGYTADWEFVLGKNDNYWNASNVKTDYVTVTFLDPDASLKAFQDKKIDITSAIPASEAKKLADDGKLEFLPDLSTSFFVINSDTELKALQDTKVRQALSMAIDRTTLIQAIGQGAEKPATGFVPFGMKDADGTEFRETAGSYYLTETADLEQAKKLLEEAGYPNGEGIDEVEIVFNSSATAQTISEAVQGMWTELGITVKLTSQELEEYYNTRANLQYSAVAKHNWVGDYADPQSFLQLFVTGNEQSGNAYSNDNYDRQIEAAMVASGKERYDALYEAEKILMEDAYIIPLYYGSDSMNKLAISKDKIKGWSTSPTGLLWLGDAEVK